MAEKLEEEVLESARDQINALVDEVGEDNFAIIVEDISIERLKSAVGRLYSSSWWQKTLIESLQNPTMYNTALLCKLLDKAVPTQQAVKVGAEEGFRLIVEQVPLPEKESKDG